MFRFRDLIVAATSSTKAINIREGGQTEELQSFAPQLGVDFDPAQCPKAA
jgi:hypothetical protein